MALVKQHASQVNEITATAKERVDLAKALIRAADKPKRTSNSRTSEAGGSDSKTGTDSKTGSEGEAAA